MKVLFEVTSEVDDHRQTSCSWIDSRPSPQLFIIEKDTKLRVISADKDAGKDLQVASLTNDRRCTSWSFSHDGSLLALVVNKKQIYLWEVRTNTFTSLKLTNRPTSQAGKRARSKDIEIIAWSKLTNKFVACHATGQLIIYSHDGRLDEKFVDHSDGVLGRVVQVECSEYVDAFACITMISEVLVMTFDGEMKFYIHCKDVAIDSVGFSPVSHELNIDDKNRRQIARSQKFWLSYRTNSDNVHLRRISMSSATSHSNNDGGLSDLSFAAGDGDAQMKDLLDMHWVGTDQFLVGFGCGSVYSVRIGKSNSAVCDYNLDVEKVLDASVILSTPDPGGSQELRKLFKFAFKNQRRSSSVPDLSVSLIAATTSKIVYYEFFALNESSKCKFEKVDELDLSGNLEKIGVSLEQVSLSPDCAMVAFQLTNGHVLVYRTKLDQHMTTSYGSKVAYMSDKTEITVLNYGFDEEEQGSAKGSLTDASPTYSGNNALVLDMQLKPSVIAIGSNHLAVALNNRVLYYRMTFSDSDAPNRCLLVDEQDYSSIVIAMSLSTRFVALLFSDGRLKLHAIRTTLRHNTGFDSQRDYSPPSEDYLDERFFPDPMQPETITAFLLTEDHFVYSTQEGSIKVYSLKDWAFVQTCDCSRDFKCPIRRLRSNERGNKLVCLLDIVKDGSPNCYLYDLRTNKIVHLFKESFYSSAMKDQLPTILATSGLSNQSAHLLESIQPTPAPVNQILDAVWDTDGRTLLLIERCKIHLTIVLDHTLDDEGSCVEYVSTISKASSYATLYVSQGIVSFQTSLGRVINSILDTHDDDANLLRLEQRIQALKDARSNQDSESHRRHSIETTRLKMVFLRQALASHSLVECKHVCENLMTDEQFNIPHENGMGAIDSLVWHQLANWALYKCDLNFALLIYRNNGMRLYAEYVSNVLKESRARSLGSKKLVRAKLRAMLGHQENDMRVTAL